MGNSQSSSTVQRRQAEEPVMVEKSRVYQVPVTSTQLSSHVGQDLAWRAYKIFLDYYPQYEQTEPLDLLRLSDFARLDQAGETYVDYMGGSLHPDSIVLAHMAVLSSNIMGNTHSVSTSSQVSSTYANKARAAVLDFFHAPPEYTVTFTPNASGALKLIGESFPFTRGGSYVIGVDSHNSVTGIRQFALQKGARVAYIESTPHGGMELSTAMDVLRSHKPRSRVESPSLFALTGQSNISNSKNPLSLLHYASSLGYSTLLDAAALAPTSVISLEKTLVDAMAVSFYKMFGYPTGVGALVVKKSFLEQLERPWFAGGTVDVVQVPGTIVTMSPDIHERFEDGTINYLALPAIADGPRLLSNYLPFLPLRLSCLVDYLSSSLLRLHHQENSSPVVRILSRLPTRRLTNVGDQSDTGFTVSFVFLSPNGHPLPITFVEHAASIRRISLRTGCMCNPGAAAAMLGAQNVMEGLYDGIHRKDIWDAVGRELGVVRVSFGLASTFQDVWCVLQFASGMSRSRSRQAMWDAWVKDGTPGN
ncbi:hypothetical protein JAAARDRAFT_59174 [Jaapia argillacea MUCL 33604]|uniref:Aminotransferase class V domain-containing protein n=1 Tax=Jaapia argillacea MUCL 33604 TaxID=933084 RepID=A0A067PN94_9AGAM|nr:hypothetical protein JAAARDRAFT_59174 [Jaapia argillacea MUCL 33604]